MLLVKSNFWDNITYIKHARKKSYSFCLNLDAYFDIFIITKFYKVNYYYRSHNVIRGYCERVSCLNFLQR
jgi:hypothetical protein